MKKLLFALLLAAAAAVAAFYPVSDLKPEEPPPPVAAPAPAPAPPAPVSIGCPGTVLPSLAWLTVNHNADGTWGDGPVELEERIIGRTGVTALALLPLLGAGYSPFSRDLVAHPSGMRCFGSEISKALDWLILDQRPDGTFRSAEEDPFDQILAAFALSEAYGITAKASLKKPAQDAVQAMIQLQRTDGSWGGAGPTTWAIFALGSAILSELDVDRGALGAALQSRWDRDHPGEALARILTADRAGEAAHRLQQESLERDPGDVAWWYLSTMALWAHDGVRRDRRNFDSAPGPAWTAWSPGMKKKLLPLMRKDGSVAGMNVSDTVVRTSLFQLTLEVYYRYSNIYLPR